MAAKNMFLYWGSGSAPCWKVLITLEEKLLSGYGQKMISFSADEHKSDEIKKLNPRGQVPTFSHGDVVLNESSGVCNYLENQFKNQGTRLIPDDASKQATVLQRMYEVENIIEKGRSKIMFYIWRNKDNIDEEVLKERKQELAKEMTFWENYLKTPYIAGDEFTMADVFFFPWLALLVRGSLSFEGRPNLKRYYEELCKRPSIVASWPPHYKESPPSQVFVGV